MWWANALFWSAGSGRRDHDRGQRDRDRTWAGRFTLMYFMFVIVGAGGLMVTANLSPIAKDLKVDAIPVGVFGLTMAALTWAATIIAS